MLRHFANFLLLLFDVKFVFVWYDLFSPILFFMRQLLCHEGYVTNTQVSLSFYKTWLIGRKLFSQITRFVCISREGNVAQLNLNLRSDKDNCVTETGFVKGNSNMRSCWCEKRDTNKNNNQILLYHRPQCLLGTTLYYAIIFVSVCLSVDQLIFRQTCDVILSKLGCKPERKNL